MFSVRPARAHAERSGSQLVPTPSECQDPFMFQNMDSMFQNMASMFQNMGTMFQNMKSMFWNMNG